MPHRTDARSHISNLPQGFQWCGAYMNMQDVIFILTLFYKEQDSASYFIKKEN
jgi:hypothetical protein